MAGVMEVVVPDGVEAEPAFRARTDEFGILRLVLSDDYDIPVVRGGSGASGQLREDVLIGVVEDLLRRVETQPVEVEFANPVTSILANVFPDRRAVGSVEVQRPSPFVRILVRRIGVRKNGR